MAHVFGAEMWDISFLPQRLIERKGTELLKVKVVLSPDHEIVGSPDELTITEADSLLLKGPRLSPQLLKINWEMKLMSYDMYWES